MSRVLITESPGKSLKLHSLFLIAMPSLFSYWFVGTLYTVESSEVCIPQEPPWEPRGMPPSMGRRLNSYWPSLANHPPTPTMLCGWRFTWPCLLSRVVLEWTAPEAREKALGQDTPKRGCKHAGEHWSVYVWARSELFSTDVFEFGSELVEHDKIDLQVYGGTFTKWSYLHFEDGLYCRKLRTSS